MAIRDHFRAYGRRRVDVEAAMRAHEEAVSRPARVRDLGLGGACVELPGAALDPEGGGLAPGVLVTLEIVTPTRWDPILLRGAIAWARRDGDAGRAGIRFEHDDSAALFALLQLLGAHAAESR